MKKKRINTILNIIILLLVAVLVFAGYKLFIIGQEADESADQYQQLEQIIHEKADSEESYATASEKYQSIYDLNNDFIGWIYIPDTPLSYPVVQTKDDPEHYLRLDFNKKYSDYGVPFMDYKCTVDESDNIIIYGHNMLNKTMFSAVESYASKGYWEQHPYVGFDSMNGFGTYQVAICARIDLTTSDFHYTEGIDFSNRQQFNDYIAQAKAHSTYDTGVELTYGDKLLLLSTCEYQYEEGRYIIIAKKISDNDLRTTLSE